MAASPPSLFFFFVHSTINPAAHTHRRSERTGDESDRRPTRAHPSPPPRLPSPPAADSTPAPRLSARPVRGSPQHNLDPSPGKRGEHPIFVCLFYSLPAARPPCRSPGAASCSTTSTTVSVTKREEEGRARGGRWWRSRMVGRERRKKMRRARRRVLLPSLLHSPLTLHAFHTLAHRHAHHHERWPPNRGPVSAGVGGCVGRDAKRRARVIVCARRPRAAPCAPVCGKWAHAARPGGQNGRACARARGGKGAAVRAPGGRARQFARPPAAAGCNFFFFRPPLPKNLDPTPSHQSSAALTHPPQFHGL